MSTINRSIKVEFLKASAVAFGLKLRPSQMARCGLTYPSTIPMMGGGQSRRVTRAAPRFSAKPLADGLF